MAADEVEIEKLRGEEKEKLKVCFSIKTSRLTCMYRSYKNNDFSIFYCRSLRKRQVIWKKCASKNQQRSLRLMKRFEIIIHAVLVRFNNLFLVTKQFKKLLTWMENLKSNICFFSHFWSNKKKLRRTYGSYMYDRLMTDT